MPMVDMDGTGKNIRFVMDRAGKTVKDIQQACGLTTCNAIYKWLNGVCMPTVDNLVIIAFICGVTVNDIIAVR